MKITENLIRIEFEDIQIGDTFYLNEDSITNPNASLCCVKTGKDEYLPYGGFKTKFSDWCQNKRLCYVPFSQFVESQQRKFIPQNNDMNLQNAIHVVNADNPKKDGSYKVNCPDCGYENYYSFFQHNGMCECEHCKTLFWFFLNDDEIEVLPYLYPNNYKEMIEKLREKEVQNANV